MPELPEVEHLRRTLEPLIVGARVRDVRLVRRDVLRLADEHGDITRLNGHGVRVRRQRLLGGAVIERLMRHGKQLAIISDRGPLVCVHLGMTGQMRVLTHRQRPPHTDHIHCQWRLTFDDDRPSARLVFRDPRRFGGLWAYDNIENLRSHRWSALGPDALTITARRLHQRLQHTSRPIKAALLDQGVLAGLGNIYADEALFKAGIHPRTSTSVLNQHDIQVLSRAIRSTLRRAVNAGGTSFRDYLDGNGVAGRYVASHAVYGRAGESCRRCGRTLCHDVVAQRTTVYCRACQPLEPAQQPAAV